MSIYTRQPVKMQLTEQQKRIALLSRNRPLQETLADRTQPIPEGTNLELLLQDLSQIYLGMSDSIWPMR